MTTAHLLGSITAGIGVVLVGWLICIGVQAWRQRHQPDEFAAADQAPIRDIREREEDTFVRDLRAAAAEVRTITMPAVHRDDGSLPTADTRTAQIASLRDDCEHCGFDHIGPCLPAAADLEVDDYITGEIVKITGDETQTDLTTVLVSKLDEFHTEWHWVGGKLYPPTCISEALHEDDWLRQLLESELVPA